VFIGPAIEMGLDFDTHNHDPSSFIMPHFRSQLQINGLPVSMMMNINSMDPTRFFNQQSLKSKFIYLVFSKYFQSYSIPILFVNGTYATWSENLVTILVIQRRFSIPYG